MNRDKLIKNTFEHIRKLPDEKLQEIADFAEFLLNKIEEQTITEGIQKIVEEGQSFEFLKEEEDIYTVEDLKKRYK